MALKIKELREKKAGELDLLQNDLRRELGEARLKAGLGTFTNTARFSQIKREIARIQTLKQGRKT